MKKKNEIRSIFFFFLIQTRKKKTVKVFFLDCKLVILDLNIDGSVNQICSGKC